MGESVQNARDDLAFMRAIAADRDRLPGNFGAQLAVPGVIFGITTLIVWRALASDGGADADWLHWIGIVATAVYLPTLLLLKRTGRETVWGPSKRLFMASWSAMGVMGAATLVCLILARGQVDAVFLLLWPALSSILWGGSWVLIAMVRREAWQVAVAGGCFLTAAVCAALIGEPQQWLALGIGILLFVAGPGLLIMQQARVKD
jgi:hypothetical protein